MFRKISILSGLAIMAVAISPVRAPAQVTDNCPVTVEQIAYNMTLQIDAGQQLDPNQVFAVGRDASVYCPDRYNAQGLAAGLLLRVYAAAQTPKQKKDILQYVMRAVSLNDLNYDKSKETLIKQPDGSTKPLYTHFRVTGYLEDVIAPTFVKLAASGEDMSALIAPDMTSCPYAQDQQERAANEADFLEDSADGMKPKEITAVADRIKALKKVCTEQNARLTSALGELYKKAATQLISAGNDAQKYRGDLASMPIFEKAAASVERAKPYMQAQLALPDDGTITDIDDIQSHTELQLLQFERFLTRYEIAMTCRKTQGSFIQITDPCPTP